MYTLDVFIGSIPSAEYYDKEQTMANNEPDSKELDDNWIDTKEYSTWAAINTIEECEEQVED